MNRQTDGLSAEERFAVVFAHLGAITAYARRRGSRDADGIAAEVMTIAWRRLADVPRDDPRPWLYATARNIVWSQSRRRPVTTGGAMLESAAAPLEEPASLEPAVATALAALSALDREVLLLVAWEDLTPAQAARP